MTEPDMTVLWTPATHIERVLLNNGRVVDIEWPTIGPHRDHVWTQIRAAYGEDAARAGSTVLNHQQELL